MRIHDAYVLRLYLRVLLFCVIGFTTVFILIDVFEKIDSFIDNEAKLVDVSRFFAYKIPDMVRLTLPVDVLLATMFTLGVFGRNNELVALIAGGVSLVRIALPMLVMALLAVAASVALAEYVVPETNAAMHRVKRIDIEKRPPLDLPMRHDFTYYGREHYLVFAKRFNTRKQELSDVVVSFVDGGRLTARLDAERGVWRDGLWEFHNGFYRSFADSLEAAEQFRQPRVYREPRLIETPDELARLEPEPDAMTYGELKRFVQLLELSGAETHAYRVDLHAKLSYPFTILIMALLAVGLSASKKKASIAASFTFTLFIAFGYLIIVGIAEAFGKNGAMPPLLAAWAAPLAAAMASAYFLARVNR
jgi:lipopolysaccharide export system permease protein